MLEDLARNDFLRVDSPTSGWSDDSISTVLCHCRRFQSLNVEIESRDCPDMGDWTVCQQWFERWKKCSKYGGDYFEGLR